MINVLAGHPGCSSSQQRRPIYLSKFGKESVNFDFIDPNITGCPPFAAWVAATKAGAYWTYPMPLCANQSGFELNRRSVEQSKL
jgi:hypothetical protein